MINEYIEKHKMLSIEGIVRSNMPYLFDGSSDPYKYHALLKEKYSIYQLPIKEAFKIVNKKLKQKYFIRQFNKFENLYEKRKEYSKLLEEKFDYVIQVISEWLDRRHL